MTFVASQATRDAAAIRRFGESVQWLEPGAPPRDISAVFQNPARPRDGVSRRVESSDPTLLVLRSDVSDLSRNTRVRIRGTSYRIREANVDEGDVAHLKLEEL